MPPDGYCEALQMAPDAKLDLDYWRPCATKWEKSVRVKPILQATIHHCLSLLIRQVASHSQRPLYLFHRSMRV
jgi:hypothetical protein